MKIKSIILATLVFMSTKNADAGEVKGGGEHYDLVMPGRTDVYDFHFEVGEIARIRVKGDGSTDLDFYVYDYRDVEVASDLDNTDLCSFRWVPSHSGYYTLKIKNRSSTTSNFYQLSWN